MVTSYFYEVMASAHKTRQSGNKIVNHLACQMLRVYPDEYV